MLASKLVLISLKVNKNYFITIEHENYLLYVH